MPRERRENRRRGAKTDAPPVPVTPALHQAQDPLF